MQALSQLSYGPRDGKHTDDLRRGSTEGAISGQLSAISHQPESIKPVPDGVARLREPLLRPWTTLAVRPDTRGSASRG